MFVCVNRIRVTGSTERYEQVYQEGSDFMAGLPGHVRHKLLRSQQDPTVYFSVAEWADAESYRRMGERPEVRQIFDQVGEIIEIENHECLISYQGE